MKTIKLIDDEGNIKEETYYTSAEVCEFFGLKRSSLSSWISKSLITPAIIQKNGKKISYLFTKEEIKKVQRQILLIKSIPNKDK